MGNTSNSKCIYNNLFNNKQNTKKDQSYNKIKIVNIETNENTQYIEIRIKNRLNEKFTINQLKINGEKYILDYKIIPEEVVRIFKTFNFKNSSVWQRVDYWRDGIDILKPNWLIGNGGNAWRMQYGQVQDYLYYAKEVHCYILEVWMSFGITGIISYIFLICITILNCQSEKNKDILSIMVGISIIIIHSLMDFDMSYLIIEMIFFMMIAILNRNDKNIQKNIKICDSVVTVIFMIIGITNLLGLTAKLVENQNVILSNRLAPWVSRYQYNKIVYIENNKIQDFNKMKYLKKFIKNEPYQYQNTIYKIMCDEIMKNVNENDINYIMRIWEDIDFERKYEIEQIRDKAEVMLGFAKKLIEKEEYEYANKVLKLIKQEYEENNNIILDYQRNKLSETISKFEHGYYKDTYNEAVNLLKEDGK